MKLSRSYRNPMVKHDPEPHMVKQTLSAAKLLPRMIRSLSPYTERDSDKGFCSSRDRI